MTPAARLHNELIEASKERFTQDDAAYVDLLARVCDALAELDQRQREEITPEMTRATQGRPSMNDAVLERMAKAAAKEIFDDLEEPTTEMMAAAVERGRESGYTDVVGIWKVMLAAKRKEIGV